MALPPLVETVAVAVGLAILIALALKVYTIDKSKPLLWKVISSVVSQLFAMQLTRILAVIAPPEEQALKRLAMWVITYFIICGWLYKFHVYTENKYTKRTFWHAPCDALAWVVFGLANSFSEAALPAGATEDVLTMGAVVLLVQLLVFYLIWIVPRAMKIGFPDASDVQGSQLLLGVHGDRGGTLESLTWLQSLTWLDHSHATKVGKWLEDCDSICWWGAGYTTAFTALRMFWLHHGQNPDCTLTFQDACSWEGHSDFWFRTTVALLVATAVIAQKLLEMKQDSAFKNVVGSTLLTALTTATTMSFLWSLRAGASSELCKNLGISDGCSELFLVLMVAYVSTAIATLSAYSMPKLVARLKGNQTNPSLLTMLQYVHESLADMAALSWVWVFLFVIDNAAFDNGFVQKDTIPVLMIICLVSLYVYVITPARPPINPLGISPQDDKPELVIDMEVRVKPFTTDSDLMQTFKDTIESFGAFYPPPLVSTVTPVEPRSASPDPATVHLHCIVKPTADAEKVAKDVRAQAANKFQTLAPLMLANPEPPTVVVFPMATPTDPPSLTPVGPPLRGFVLGVYGILCAQIATVVGVCIVIALSDYWRSTFLHRYPDALFGQLAVATFVVLCLLYCYKAETTLFGFTCYPNCCLLVVFTLLLALDLNAALSFDIEKQIHTQADNVMILSTLFSAIIFLVIFLAKLFGAVDPKKMSVVCFAISYAVFQAEELFLPELVVKAFSASNYITVVISMLSALGMSKFVAGDVKKLSAVHPPPTGGPATWKDAVPATIDIYFDVLNLLFFLTPWEVS